MIVDSWQVLAMRCTKAPSDEGAVICRFQANDWGSDPSAACGRFSEGSEWQRSKKSRESVSPMIFSSIATGERTTIPPSKIRDF